MPAHFGCQCELCIRVPFALFVLACVEANSLASSVIGPGMCVTHELKHTHTSVFSDSNGAG